MPNWTRNVVEFSHADPAMMERLAKTEGGNLFTEFFPCPVELIETNAQAGTNEKEKANFEKYGYSSWYDWQVANWGTKWDVTPENIDYGSDNNLTMSFDSAWSPPLEGYAKFEELGFAVKAYYYEEGMQFAGIYLNGEDEYYSNWENSDDAEAMLPTELDEMFAISENLRMDENDNNDEEEF